MGARIGEKPIKFSDLCRQFEASLVETGYRNYSLHCYKTVLKDLLHFVGDSYFSIELCSKYLVEKSITERPDGKKKSTATYLFFFRTIRYLSEYRSYGRFYTRSRKPLEKEWPASFSSEVCSYLESLVDNKSTSYKNNSSATLKSFVDFLETHEVHSFSDITPDHLSKFILSLVGYSDCTIASKLSILRCFFRYLYSLGLIPIAIGELVPFSNPQPKVKEPTLWTEEEIKKILDAIDRGSPIGKRDYAMILLVIKYGLRIGEVSSLKISNIDWENNKFLVEQRKTQKQLSLPLLREVGWAIIDYLKNGRPPSESENLFLRHIAPFLPFSSSNCHHHVLVKYINLAGIKAKRETKTGMHSLRYTLASKMIQSGVGIETISQLLGHSSLSVTNKYIKVNIAGLRKCALNVVVLDNEN